MNFKLFSYSRYLLLINSHFGKKLSYYIEEEKKTCLQTRDKMKIKMRSKYWWYENFITLSVFNFVVNYSTIFNLVQKSVFNVSDDCLCSVFWNKPEVLSEIEYARGKNLEFLDSSENRTNIGLISFNIKSIT